MMVLTPLRWVLAWLLLVVADFRVNGFDLLPDALGWSSRARCCSRSGRSRPGSPPPGGWR
ncbi:hypothetical protein [Nocardioides bruguierae]|uniref:hypothetical protein n=1 Tax=Nocardioides bruguierae TaxID=2945102 RepID=UPI0020221582|nr:hypothetical protein [Nocardioides bruguierae]MCL8025668.1 hypothetical protein [Nocardioides bruguierae]